MNRTVKFRVLKGKEILAGRDLDNISISLDGEVLVSEGNELVLAGDEYALQQFTGFSDAKGKKIYEGDLIRLRVCKGIGEVVVSMNGFYIMNEYGHFYQDTINQFGQSEVIGNILGNATY